MFLLKTFLSNLYQKKITDEYFGKLVFNKVFLPPDFKSTYWKCSKFFTPLNEIISIEIETDKGGPKTEHKALFKEIMEKYEGLIDIAQKYIEADEFREYVADIRVEDVKIRNDFNLSRIEISDRKDNKHNWGLTLKSKTNNDVVLNISFENFEVEDVYIFNLNE